MAGQKLLLSPKPPKGEDGYKVFSVRIELSLVTQIEDLARQTGHTRNELVGILLRFAVDNCELVK